jgi:hypothetical protein
MRWLPKCFDLAGTWNEMAIGGSRPQALREAHHEHAMSRIARDQGAALPGF